MFFKKSQASGNKRHSSYIYSHFKIIVKAEKRIYITTSGGNVLNKKGLSAATEGLRLKKNTYIIQALLSANSNTKK